MWSNNNTAGGGDSRNRVEQKDRTYEALHYPQGANGTRGPDSNKNRFVDAPRYRVVEQVAYAHPVREQPLYYAAQPSFPPSGTTTFGVHSAPQQPKPQIGYPYFYGNQPSSQQFVNSDRIGHAKVKRAPNSDCMLHDPAETLVIDYADGSMRNHRKGHRHAPVPQSSSSPSGNSRSSSMPPPKGAPPVQHHPRQAHHPLPISLSSDLHSASEVTITPSSSRAGPSHQEMFSNSVDRQPVHHIHHHHHHHHNQYFDQQLDGNRDHDSVDGTSTGLHHDFVLQSSGGFHQLHFNHHHPNVHQVNYRRPLVPRGSHSSDTSSAYSGSDTMQSLHSSCENEPIDLNGLHESVVDSDEDLADSLDSLAIRDIVRDSLEKDPVDRTEEDIDVLLGFTQSLEAFNRYTIAVRRALCSVMVFAVVEKAGTIVMNDKEELDSWSVIINGEVRIDRSDPESGQKSKKILKCGDAFGIEPTMEKLYHQGVMRTVQDDCQFVCITQVDYYKILNEGESNRRCYEEDGKIVLVTEIDAPSKSNSHKVIRGTAQRLLAQLIDENSAIDPTYVEDFLLTHRTFMTSQEVILYLLQLMNKGELMDRVTRVLLLWVHNHFPDFETDPVMMEYLEKFEAILERENKNGQLRMLNFACAEKAKKRVVIITRPCREEKLQFTLMGGYERNFGIFVETVEKGSKASDAGLKRGDQILEVNRKSFDLLTIQKATTILMENTHLEMMVKSNLLVFKELLQNPDEKSPRQRLRKTSDLTGLRPSSEYTVSGKGRSQDDAATLKPQPSYPGHPISKREKMKHILVRLTRPKVSSSSLLSEPELTGVANLEQYRNTSLDSWDMSMDGPDHSLKIYKSDQQFKYLLVHQNTSAREVVMLALQKFGITECSSNYTLCEVKVDGGFVSQKRLSPEQTNLAEKLGLGSRYYVKNIMSSDQLIPEDSISELVKESQVHILQLHAMETATQLMVEDFTIFRQIETTEYIDKLFELRSKLGTPNLTRFGELVNKEMMWTITEIVSEPIIARRVKLIKQFIKIAQHCYKETQNFNSMFAIVSGLDHVVVRRLKSTWDKVPVKYTKLLGDMLTVMDPSMNFRRYRNLINSARPPIIPIYPMVNKDLTFIHLGNESYVDELVNFEKLRMLAKEIRSFNNMCSAPLDLFTMLERQGSDFSDAMRKMNPPTHVATMKRGMNAAGMRGGKETHNEKKMYEEAQMVRRVKAYLNRMPLVENEDELMQLSLKCESSNLPSSASLHNQLGHNHSQKQTRPLNPSVSASSISSSHEKPSRRMPSPSPSNGSTTSSTSLISEGKKSTNSAAKFGTDSPQAVRKLMSLSEPGKTRRHQPKHSVSSLHTNPSPGNSPKAPRKTSGHERSASDSAPPVSLSAESSSVATLSTARKGEASVSGKSSSVDDATAMSKSRSLPRPHPKEHQRAKMRMARTLSRDQPANQDDDPATSAV